MTKPTEADRIRSLLSSGYTIAALGIVFMVWAGWMAAILSEELGP
jgi:hypothetical protein